MLREGKENFNNKNLQQIVTKKCDNKKVVTTNFATFAIRLVLAN